MFSTDSKCMCIMTINVYIIFMLLITKLIYKYMYQNLKVENKNNVPKTTKSSNFVNFVCDMFQYNFSYCY